MIRVLDLRPQVDALIKDFGTLQRKQAVFAVRWTNNALARDIDQATRNAIQQRLRTSPAGLAYLQRHVRVLSPGSTMGKIHLPQGGDQSMRAFVGVIPPEGKGQHAGPQRYRGSLLAMLEGGGPTPGPRDFGGVTGIGRYAVPVRRPGDRTPVPLRMFPINLGLQARRSISGALTRGGLRGKQRTYLIPIANRPGHSMIFQRFGKERDATMPLFATQPQTRLPARRYFFPTAERIINTRLHYHFSRAMQQALFGRGAYRG